MHSSPVWVSTNGHLEGVSAWTILAHDRNSPVRTTFRRDFIYRPYGYALRYVDGAGIRPTRRNDGGRKKNRPRRLDLLPGK